MDARQYWLDYVERNGGLVAVSEKLDIEYPTLASVSNGHRGMGKSLVERIVKSDPSLDASILVWIKPIKPYDKAKKKTPMKAALTSVGSGRYMAFGTLEEITKLIWKEVGRGGG